MFTDTGNMSFWLGVFFILISLLGIFFAFFVAHKKLVEHESLEKIIDLGKWFIVSVAITLSASIVNDGFKERDQDIKEMEVFDKYTSIILAADGVDQRKLLSEYFSTVSPDGSIKDSWREYKVIVDNQISELKNVQAKSMAIAAKADKGQASESELVEKARLEERATVLNKSLLPAPAKAALKPRIYFHIKENSQRPKAEQLAKDIAALANVVVPGVQQLTYSVTTTQLRYYRKKEEPEARQFAAVFSSLGLNADVVYIAGFESSTKIRSGHYELWIADIVR